MDAEGNLYATTEPVPDEDKARLEAWHRELADDLKRARAQLLTTDPRSILKSEGIA